MLAHIRGDSWVEQLGAGIFFASLILLHYVVLTGLFNRTSVRCGSGRLAVRIGPIPAAGNREISRDQIRQLHVIETRTERDNPKTTHYDLYAQLINGDELRLLQGLDELAQARYLEHLFEQQLEIEKHASSTRSGTDGKVTVEKSE